MVSCASWGIRIFGAGAHGIDEDEEYLAKNPLHEPLRKFGKLETANNDISDFLLTLCVRSERFNEDGQGVHPVTSD